jgi:hypothetical protein
MHHFGEWVHFVGAFVGIAEYFLGVLTIWLQTFFCAKPNNFYALRYDNF